MVLKDSKWDHKAKVQYLRKHGLTKPKEEPKVQPKWSSKKQVARNTPLLEDSDDSDEEFLRLYYPQLGEELTAEQKEKIKEQIRADLKANQDTEPACPEDASTSEAARAAEAAPDGIYLGSEESRQEYLATKNVSQLDHYISHNMAATDVSAVPKKNRKMPRNKMSEDLLDEYGLSDYQQTIKSNQDYSAPYLQRQSQRNIDKISDLDLIGFRIGEDSIARKGSQSTGASIAELNDQEKEDARTRREASEQAKLYRQMKARFGSSSGKAPTLEINNINQHDPHQMQILNSRLAQQGFADDGDLDDDLADLLGGTATTGESRKAVVNKKASNQTDIDDFLASLSVEDQRRPISSSQPKITYKPAAVDDSFLDELLD